MMCEQMFLPLGGVSRASGGISGVAREPVRRELSATTIQARAASERTAAGVRRMVLEFLAGRPGGATDGELELAFPTIPPSSLRGRRRELERDGLVRDSGRRGRSKTGKAAIIWEAV